MKTKVSEEFSSQINLFTSAAYFQFV